MDKSDILLSVCITTFNMEKYIEIALESVLMQKVNFDFEIIVADDCSTDKTLPILEKYKTKYDGKFNIIRSKENKGIMENCAKALRQAKGKYIAFLDADDYWSNEYKLQTQTDFLENNSEIDFVHTNFIHTDETRTKSSLGQKAAFTHPTNEQYERFLVDPYICSCTMCFRKKLIDFDNINLYIEKRFFSQDYSLFLDFCLRGKGAYLDFITATIVLRKNSLSRQQTPEKKIKYFYNCYTIGNYFISKYPINNKALLVKRNFNFKLKVLLASWESGDYNYMHQYTKELKLGDFLRNNPKAAYIYLASKSKILYKLLQPWVLRKRKPGR